MKYCTNCGERITQKKVCGRCGIQYGTTNRFCRWCATEIPATAKKCPNCGEKAKRDFVLATILGYVIGIVCIIGGLCTIGMSAAMGIPFTLLGIVALPAIRNLIRVTTCQKGILHKVAKVLRLIVLVVLFVLVVVASDKVDRPTAGTDTGSSDVGVAITTESEAVKAADKYMAQNKAYINQLLADKLGYETFYDPQYGGKDVVSRNGHWNITYYGNMTGYLDKYKTNIEMFKIEVLLTVKENGDITVNVFKG